MDIVEATFVKRAKPFLVCDRWVDIEITVEVRRLSSLREILQTSRNEKDARSIGSSGFHM